MQEDCVFCKIVKGELPSKKEYDDKDVLVIHDIDPIAPVHLLAIPKKHLENLSAATSNDLELLGKLQLVAAEMARKMGIDKDFRVLTANGVKAGQVIFHLHYHIIGGWEKTPDWKTVRKLGT